MMNELFIMAVILGFIMLIKHFYTSHTSNIIEPHPRDEAAAASYATLTNFSVSHVVIKSE
jgi:hypothetical protein